MGDIIKFAVADGVALPLLAYAFPEVGAYVRTMGWKRILALASAVGFLAGMLIK